MTALPGDLTLGAGRTIGRYFGVVSFVPTLLLTGYLALLFASGAWTRRPDFGRAFSSLDALPTAGLFAVVAGALVAAVALHSLQFAIVQVLEGYWGGNAVMRYLRLRRTTAHIDQYEAANDMYDLADARLHRPDVDEVAGRLSLIQQADALQVIASYPELMAAQGEAADPAAYFLPTRLGNILRRYELRIGRPYELDVLSQATQILLAAQPEHVAYLQDQRHAMDLSARMCATALIASVATFVLMLPWDVWMLLTAVPYAAAYVAYRATLVAARHYGEALEAVVVLNRFRFYRSLCLGLPADTDDERRLNRAWSGVRTGDSRLSVSYVHAPLTDIDPSAAPTAPSDAAPGD